MSLRKIDETIELPDLSDFQAAKEYADQWQSLNCRLVTPLHGGGVKARESDVAMPIRVAGIRGQLRFWWRLLAQHQFKLPEKDIRAAEFALWGGTSSDDDNGGQASLVFLRVISNSKKLPLAPLHNYTKSLNDTLGYALFTARENKREKQPEMKLGEEGFEWTLQWRLNRHARCYNFDYDNTQKKWVKVPFKQEKYDGDLKQVHETLRWWATLGGIGGRTRRGCGAIQIDDVPLISQQEMENLGCQILFSGSLKEKSSDAWKNAIDEWKNIRKGQHKKALKNLVEQQNSRHLATVFSRPVRDENSNKWCGMIVMLPNSTSEIKKILGDKS